MESATILMPRSTCLSSILLPPEPNIPKRPEYKKISTLCLLIYAIKCIESLSEMKLSAFTVAHICQQMLSDIYFVLLKKQLSMTAQKAYKSNIYFNLFITVEVFKSRHVNS